MDRGSPLTDCGLAGLPRQSPDARSPRKERKPYPNTFTRTYSSFRAFYLRRSTKVSGLKFVRRFERQDDPVWRVTCLIPCREVTLAIFTPKPPPPRQPLPSLPKEEKYSVRLLTWFFADYRAIYCRRSDPFSRMTRKVSSIIERLRRYARIKQHL